MNVVIMSNFMNHHQEEIVKSFQKQGCIVIFYETEKIPQERLNMGYSDYSKKHNYIKQVFNQKTSDIIREIDDADIFIIGGTKISSKYYNNRIKKNKIIFRYSERVFKNKDNRLKIKDYIKILYYKLKLNKESKSNSFLLASSYYTPEDYKKMNLYNDKILKWGYFPIINKNKDIVLSKDFNKISFIWVGRMIDLKQPLLTIEIIHSLILKGYDVDLTMIGDGPLLDRVKNKSMGLNIFKNIKFISSVNYDEIGKYYSEKNIFLFTSDFNEGWGAVLNEAMSYGCVPFSTYSSGASFFLIEENKNGFIIKFDLEEIVSKIVNFINLPINEKEEISRSAYKTIEQKWNSDVAVKNLINFYKSGNKMNLISDGPMSRVL